MTKQDIKDLSPEKRQLIDKYCINDMKQLRRVVDKLIARYGLPMEFDDDFYSVSLYVLLESAVTYDESNNTKFETYLVGNLMKRFSTFIRDINRKKDIPLQYIVSLDNQTNENDENTYHDLIASGVNVENMVFAESIGNISDEKAKEYLSKLTIEQKKIICLLAEGYDSKTIIKILKMDSKKYYSNLSIIRDYKNIKILSNLKRIYG